MILDHQPIPIELFKGQFGIDDYQDSVPDNYFIDELNTVTYGSEVKTRDGFGIANTTSGITKFYVYRRPGEASRLLALIGNSIWDLTTNTNILTVTGMTGFAFQTFNGRAFISPHNGVTGLPGEFIYIYNGTGTARKAAGNAPSGSFAVAYCCAGITEAGTHIFAWVFETDTGFTTSPSPAQTIEVDGNHALNFTGVPTGPVGTARRKLIASRSIQDFNGDVEGYEMFFVPNGTIDDNVTTFLNNVDFYDADLQFSADYVYDQLAEIPATIFIATYGTMAVYGGPNADRNLVYVSKATEPESVSAVAGFFSLDPFETEGVKDATEFRDNLYITKRNKTYTVRDNGSEASTWGPVTLDSAVGADVNGIAQFYDTKGSRVEFFVVNSPAGIFKFTGTYEEIPISRNVKNIIKRQNEVYLNLGQIIFDQERMMLYVLMSLDGATSPNYILAGNYEDGFTFDRVKWHLWSFTDFSPSCIGIDRDNSRKTQLKVSSLSGNIYAQQENRRDDNGTAINHFIKFNLVGDKSNAIHHFGAVGLRIVGFGNLNMEISGEDNIDYQSLGTISLSNPAGKEIIRPAWFQSEKGSLKISLNNFGSWFRLHRVIMYVNVIFNSRPFTGS